MCKGGWRKEGVRKGGCLRCVGEGSAQLYGLGQGDAPALRWVRQGWCRSLGVEVHEYKIFDESHKNAQNFARQFAQKFDESHEYKHIQRDAVQRAG